MPVTKTCDACGDDVTRPPSRFTGERVFCNKECMSQGYDDKVDTECAHCGDSISKTKAVFDTNEKNYCGNDCMYAHQKGENAPNWRGGSDKFTTTPEGIEWRNSVFKRDEYTCQDCGRTNCRLNAHHIERLSEVPEKKADVSNGVTVCLYCHAKRHFGEQAYHLIKSNIHRLDNV